MDIPEENTSRNNIFKNVSQHRERALYIQGPFHKILCPPLLLAQTGHQPLLSRDSFETKTYINVQKLTHITHIGPGMEAVCNSELSANLPTQQMNQHQQ